MSVPTYNSDIIHIRQDWRTKVWIIPDADQRLLLRIVADLNWAIRQEMGPKHEGPLRFVIPLAMRFVEQAGPHSFRHPKGSNPYNVMGKGVLREDNQEEDARGNMYDKPAEFQAYNGERQAVARFFKLLRTAHDGAWRGAWEAIRDVQSIQAFAEGLRPKGKPHYLTRGLKTHISHLSGRAREAIKLLKIIYGGDIYARQIGALNDGVAEASILHAALHDDPQLGSDVKQQLADAKMALSDAKNVVKRLELTRIKLGL